MQKKIPLLIKRNTQVSCFIAVFWSIVKSSLKSSLVLGNRTMHYLTSVTVTQIVWEEGKKVRTHFTTPNGAGLGLLVPARTSTVPKALAGRCGSNPLMQEKPCAMAGWGPRGPGDVTPHKNLLKDPKAS